MVSPQSLEAKLRGMGLVGDEGVPPTREAGAYAAFVPTFVPTSEAAYSLRHSVASPAPPSRPGSWQAS
jgi:hypothetical protein|eukprot:COSAG02_NODE_8426_length_2575_cov_1.553312_4_plen_68_part_00